MARPGLCQRPQRPRAGRVGACIDPGPRKRGSRRPGGGGRPPRHPGEGGGRGPAVSPDPDNGTPAERPGRAGRHSPRARLVPHPGHGRGERALHLRAPHHRYPAEKIALLYFGRGEGFGGLGRDDLSGHAMSVPDFARTLARVRAATGKKIDLLVVDADFMQTAEAVHEWRAGADIVVGTPGASPRLGYLYVLAIGDLAADPSMGPGELASAFVYYAENRVTSAVKTEGIPGFIERLDRWVTAVTGDPEAMKEAREAVGRTYAYDANGCRDLYEFVGRVGGALPEGHPARTAGLELQGYLERELLPSRSRNFPERAEGDPGAGAEYERAAGLGIYLPERIYDSARYESLAFASGSKWRDFLMALLR
ncbi:MAG: hypothetical protein GXY47_08975 [Acidobacteria bacterium]|nr:hypothetical protein [Acidobacteriota bacterium]